MQLDEALKARKSARAFKPDPVPLDLVKEILELAKYSPSGTNIQPWKVHVVAGDVRRRLEEEVLAHRDTDPTDKGAEFPRTSKRKEPYTTRMRTLGKEMYGLLGIPKGDAEANWRQWGRNYQFFDAPVGLIFTIDK
ncbi:MAG: nitroreductase family protein, partial [Parvibaculum sp.]